MRQLVFPYLTARADCWQLGPWQRLGTEEDTDLAERIDDWDYSVPLSISCRVTVDVSRIREQTHLTLDDRLVMVALWEASSTGIREVGSRHELPASGEGSFELLVNLEGSRIGGQLTLERQIVLAARGESPEPLAPRAPGSIVLTEPRSERKTVILEGEAARFPTEVTDFNQLTIAEPDALWFLELDLADMEQSPLAAMRLYVNGAHPAVRRALVADDATGDLVRSVLQWDVARTLVDRALDNDEFIEEWDSFAEASVGEMLQQLIQRYWPGEDAGSLRARRETSRSRFEYQLQARLALLAGVA
jgi:hypothetical protein